MSFPEKTLGILEFDRIRALLAEHAETEGAKERARALRPSADRSEVLRRLGRTTDAKRLIGAKGLPSFGHVRDISAVCERAEKGAVLSPRELLDCARVLETARRLREYGTANRSFATSLDDLFLRLTVRRATEERITRAIPSEDLIADEASPLLSEIRRRVRAENARIRETLQKIISGHARYLQENLVTMRGGRYVIPVKAECKSEVKGLVHDASSTGATLFIEPMAVVDANNEIRVLQTREEREIERILSELSAETAGIAGDILLDYRTICELSFLFACGDLSVSMRGVAPAVSGDRTVELIGARHPLIAPDRVVPTDISLGRTYDTLIVTGPNTGGKTVTLKTLGLLSVMAQAGLHIPCEPTSSVCLFDDVLADIGDEQSIEQSLSTFSSHMGNIVRILEAADSRSLVLLDELGSGTDPVEGAALAVAIIEAIRGKGAACAATTHYAELKAYALETDGVSNASCEFDVETLRPTFRLITGVPGKSNAFAISERLGLDRGIIARARELVGRESRHFEDVIGRLNESRLQMEREREEAARLREEYEAFKEASERRIQQRLEEADRAAEDARQKAAAMVKSAKASCDFLYEQMAKMRRAQESADAAAALEEARRAVREHMRASGDRFDPVEAPDEGEDYVLPRPLRKGDRVRIVSIRREAVVIGEPKGGLVPVVSGAARAKARLEDLRLIEDAGKPRPPAREPAPARPAEDSDAFRSETDLRGMTGDEAWPCVDRFLDAAVLRGVPSVRLIHGKGTGALRNALWKYLRGDSRIASFRLGRIGEGDSGVTVVELK